MIDASGRGLISAALLVTSAIAAGVAWWFVAGDGESQVSAQEMVEAACEQVQGITDYDIESSAKGPDLVYSMSIRFSGEDSHGIAKIGEPSQTLEFTVVDGVSYTREAGQVWEISEYSFQGFALAHLLPVSDRNRLEGSTLCPELGHVARVSEESVNGTETERFRITETTNYGPLSDTGDFSDEDYVIEDAWDIWLDDDGQLVQTQRVTVHPVAGDAQGQKVEIVSKILEVGEPNVITAPTVSEQ